MKNLFKIFLIITFSTFFVSCQAPIQQKLQTNFYSHVVQSSSINQQKYDYLFQTNFKGHSNFLTDILQVNENEFITASLDKSIIIWDANQLRVKRKIYGSIASGMEGRIETIALSHDKKLLAVGGVFRDENKKNSLVRVYDYDTGKMLYTLSLNIGVISSISFSDDDKFLMYSSMDSSINIWNIENNQSPKFFHKIQNHVRGVTSVKMFRKNGKKFLISTGLDGQIMLYDLEILKVVRIVRTPSPFKKILLSNDRIYFSGYSSTSLISYDLELKNRKNILFNNQDAIQDFVVTKNNQYIISATDNNIQYYNIQKEILEKTIENKQIGIKLLLLNKTHLLSIGGYDQSIVKRNIHTNKIENVFVTNILPTNVININDNSIAWSYNNRKDLHNRSKWRVTKKFNLDNYTIENVNKSDKYQIHSSQNGSYSLEHSVHPSLMTSDGVLNLKFNNKVIMSLVNSETHGFRHTCYGWYKNFIISSDPYGGISIYTTSGQLIMKLKGFNEQIWNFSVYKDKLVAISNGNIKIWDLSLIDNYNNKNLKFKSNPLFQPALHKWIELNYGLKVTELTVPKIYNKLRHDGHIQLANSLLNVEEINPIINLIVTKDDNFIFWTNGGFFDASKGAEQYVGYHINQGIYKEAEFVTVENLYSTFYRPDLIQKALKGESLAKYAKNINIEKLLEDGLAPEVHILTKNQTTKNQDLDLKVQVCPKGNGGYDNLALTINDVPVQVINTSRALKIKKKSKRDDCFTYDQTITLAGGKNKIGFKATNKAGNIESKVAYIEVEFDDTQLRKNLVKKLKKAQGNDKINNLHVLAIAVNKYQDTELQLNYSINDATQMLKTISSVAKPLVNKVIIHKLFDKDVTKENIIKAFKNINSQRDDLFLLYIAGHGITDQYNGNYYYIPYDFINKDDKKAVQKQGVGQHDFMLVLSKVKALKSLVLLDTCNSGSFVEADLQKATTNKLAKATGRATISASSKSQVALEGFNNHGVFTYTLLEALKGKGYKEDNTITTNELSDYVEDVLPKRTYEKWGYKQIPQKSMYGVDFNLGMKN